MSAILIAAAERARSYSIYGYSIELKLSIAGVVIDVCGPSAYYLSKLVSWLTIDSSDINVLILEIEASYAEVKQLMDCRNQEA